VLASPAAGQSLTYYANANIPGAPDGTLRLANGTAQDLWADLYVFDARLIMQECCSCLIPGEEGCLTLSVNQNLTSAAETPQPVRRGLLAIRGEAHSRAA
jgi:hypothetical protein